MRVSGEGKGLRRGDWVCRRGGGGGGGGLSIYRGWNVKGLKRWGIKNGVGWNVKGLKRWKIKNGVGWNVNGLKRLRIKNGVGWNVKGIGGARNVTAGLAGLGKGGVSVHRM